MGRRSRDYSGQRFGKLVAIKPSGRNWLSGRIMWLFQCDCGNQHIAVPVFATSCGCVHRLNHTKKVKHGLSGSPEYGAFTNARRRCQNPDAINYADYGGRGIEFRFSGLDQWLAELGPRPSPYHSVDRKDVDGHYEPGNVRWATRSEQATNTRWRKAHPGSVPRPPRFTELAKRSHENV